MKKDGKNSLKRKTISTRMETPSKKPITSASSTRKSERLATSPALQTSDKGNNVLSQYAKESDNSGRDADTSSKSEQRKDKRKNNIEDSTNKIKKRKSIMSGRSYKALFGGKLKQSDALVDVSSNDEELVVVGCSRRIPAGNDDANSKRLPIGETSLEESTDVPLKLTRDTEKLVLDASPMVATGDDSIIPSEYSETQKLLVSKTSLGTNIDLPLKRKKDTAGVVLDTCATVAKGDDCVKSSDGVIPSPPGCKNNKQSEACSTCEKQQKVNGDLENLLVCSCIAQLVQESDHVAQDVEETLPATSKYGENWKNMQHDKSDDPKLHSSMYTEYWIPVQLSGVQLEQYCWNLFSKSLSLSLPLKNDPVGALEETLASARKACDHPYVMDASLKQLLTKNLEVHEVLDVEVRASGKLPLLDAMLNQIKKKGLKAVVFYQATLSTGGLLLGNILEDFLGQKFGQTSYEHGIYEHSSKKNAINNFNKDSQCFVLLLEKRACNQSIKLVRAEAFILFGSSLNPLHDVKYVEKIKIESYSERTKIFRLYSTCTVEERVLILARKNKPVENLSRPLTHALLMWGASYLFDKLDHFHRSETLESEVPFEQSIMDGVIHEFSSILSSEGGEENEGKLCLLLEAKHVHGSYSTDSTLFGEEHVKLSDEDSPDIFWKKLLVGKNHMWKYHSDTPQRNRKRVRYFQDSEASDKIGNGENTKKRKKVSDDVTDLPVTDSPVDNDERKASGKDHMGALESPKVVALQSSGRSASGTNVLLNGNGAFGYSTEGRISAIPDDMLARKDWRQIPCESQRSLHAVLKPEMAKLGKVLNFSEDWTSMVEKFLEYVIVNHHVCREPATILQAFLIALSWIAASMVNHKFNREESLVRAKSEFSFNCSREEVEYLYSILYCMKSLFLENPQGLQLNCSGTNIRQSMVGTKQVNESLSEGEERMTEKRGSHYSTATEDVKKTITDIKKKCKKKEKKLVQTHEEEKVELVNRFADKKRELETRKKLEAAVIRITYSRTSTQSLENDLKLRNHDYEKEFDEITSEMDECIKSLEQMHEAAKKNLAEDEACWVSRIENWAQIELNKCIPIRSGNSKHFSGICSSNTSKITPDVQPCNDVNGEATCADTNCMISKGSQVPEAETTFGTMLGGSTQQVYEVVASKNHKAMNISILSREQAEDNVATESQSNENTSIIVPEILIPASFQEELVALNVHEDVSSKLPEISQSSANHAKSVSPELSLNREEALVTIENNGTSHVGSNEEVGSLDKDIPDELVFPMPQPAFMVETSGSTELDQDNQDICPMPSSQAEKQPDPALNIQDQNNEASIEPQLTITETVETGGFVSSEQGDQVTSPLPSSPAGNQPDAGANIEGQNIETSAEPHVVGPKAVEMGDSVGPDQETMGAQDASSLQSSLVRTQSDIAANIEGQNITTLTQLNTAGLDVVETGECAISDQGAHNTSPLPFSSPGLHPDAAVNTTVTEPHTIAAAASPLPFSLPANHPDAGVNTEALNNTTVAEPHTTESNACEMEIAEPDPQVERSTFANIPVPQGRVEPSAAVTAPVPSVPLQFVPQLPFPVSNDPFQYELEKLHRESENRKKIYQEKKSIMKAELDRKLAELQAEFQRKLNEVKAEHNARAMKSEENEKLLINNQRLAKAFSSKCNHKNTSHTSAASRGMIQQLALRTVQMRAQRQVSAERNYPPPAPPPAPASTPAPARLQPQGYSFLSSFRRPSNFPLHTAHCPIPQPRQSLISNTAPSPSPSASPATNPVVNGRLRSSSPHLNAYRSSTSIPISTTTPTSSSLPQSLPFSTVLIRQHLQEQQQHNLNNDVVCLSDNE